MPRCTSGDVAPCLERHWLRWLCVELAEHSGVMTWWRCWHACWQQHTKVEEHFSPPRQPVLWLRYLQAQLRSAMLAGKLLHTVVYEWSQANPCSARSTSVCLKTWRQPLRNKTMRQQGSIVAAIPTLDDGTNVSESIIHLNATYVPPATQRRPCWCSHSISDSWRGTWKLPHDAALAATATRKLVQGVFPVFDSSYNSNTRLMTVQTSQNY